MGLFSFLNKNKQGGADDGDYNSRAEGDSVAARARSKRASSAGAPPSTRAREGRAALDPMLPEKKRARRRLVGAIALALGVAIGLPMLLDSEPKPLAPDIPMQLPPKDKPAPLSASATLDPHEEIVATPVAPPAAALAAPKPVAPKPAAARPAPATVAQLDARPAPLPRDAPHVEPKPARVEPKPPEPKPAALRPPPPLARPIDIRPVEPRVAEVHAAPAPKPAAKPDGKPDAKPDGKPDDKLHTPKPAASDDAARALAILEGKPHGEAAPGKIVLQVAALATQEKVVELQGKLREAGIASYTQKANSQGGPIRVRVGPFASKEEADRARAKLSKLGLSGSVVPG